MLPKTLSVSILSLVSFFPLRNCSVWEGARQASGWAATSPPLRAASSPCSGGWALSALAHQLFSRRWRLLATSTWATRNSVWDGLARLTDSDLCMASGIAPASGLIWPSWPGASRWRCGLRRTRSCLSGGSCGRRWCGGWSAAGRCWRWARPVSARGPRHPCWGPSPAEWRAGGRQPGAEALPRTRAPQAQDPAAPLGRSAEAGCTRAWGRLRLGGRVVLKTVAFSDTILFAETLALSGTTLFPETPLSSSTAIWDTEHLLGLGVSGSRLASSSSV